MNITKMCNTNSVMTKTENSWATCTRNCSGYTYGEEVEVECAEGTVRGVHVRTCYGPEFVRFAGVPYAKPPIGPLRFMPPVPMGHWTHTVDATSIKEHCWSYDKNQYFEEILGTEDCLHTTIHTLNVKPKHLMPVMVYIGSWNWSYDNPNYHGGGWLTKEKVVLVYASFRIGPFGFLSIREPAAPGNCGLKDIVMALRWIQRNISSFGGDPNNVTLFGSGSGASIVHYMMLSPLANGLFHKAIIHSGTAIHPWAFTHQPINSTRALAKELNVETKDMSLAVEKLRSFSAEKIMNAFINITKQQRHKEVFFTNDAIFKPCIETEFEGQPAFLTQSPHVILLSGKYNRVPLIIGSNRHEGVAIHWYEKYLGDLFEKLNLNFTSLVPRELRLDDSFLSSKMLGLRLMQFYVRGEKLTKENANDFYNFLTDYYYTYYVNRSVKLNIKNENNNPTFYYILDAASDWSMPEIDVFEIMKGNASYGEELSFLFQVCGCVEYGSGPESNKIRHKMLKLWTNFARFTNPTPNEDDKLLHVTWDAVTDPERIHYLSIASDLTKGCNPFYERMSFWDNVLDDTFYLRMATFFESSSTHILT